MVTFQDGLGGYAGTLDTYVHEDEPGTTHGTNAKVSADGDDDLGTAETNAQVVTGLIRFNNLFASGGGASRIGGSIPDGATIVSAVLAVRTGTASGDVSASSFDLHRMIATWDESSTWTSLSSGVSYNNTEAATAATASVLSPGANTAGGLVLFDVTSDVQLWSNDNTLSLRGWAVRPRSNSGASPVSGQTDGWWFDSSEASAPANRPQLLVSYVLAPTEVATGGPYTIDEGETLELVGSATGVGTLTYSWDVNGDGVFTDAVGNSAALTWPQLVALGINDGPSTRNLKVRVTDTYGHLVDSATTVLTVNNVAPTSDAGTGYEIAEGLGLSLLGSGSDPAGANDPLTYSWDVNGDLVFGDATGAAASLNWSQLQALGITGVGTFNVRLQVSDGDGGVTTSAPVTLNVVNAAPVASVSGPANGLRGESRSFTVSATDKPEDVTAGFTYTIHWGDGSPNTTISSTLGSTVKHAFSVAGLVTVSVTATDQHGAISSVATTTIQVDAVQLRPNVNNEALWDLVWGGTPGADQVELEQVDPTTIRVRELALNGAPVSNEQDFSGITGRVIALASAGDDVLDARACPVPRLRSMATPAATRCMVVPPAIC